MTHGSKHKRLAGALAAGTYPSRVFKATRPLEEPEEIPLQYRM